MEQRAEILTKAFGRLKFKEMRELVEVKDIANFKFKEENVGDKHEVSLGLKLCQSYLS